MDLDQLKTAHSLMKGYKNIVDVLIQHKNEQGISVISQKQLAEAVNLSQTAVSKKLKVLIKYGSIEKVKAGEYKVIHEQFIEHSPFGVVIKLLNLIGNNPDIIPNYLKQSELLGVEMKEIQRAWGFIIAIFGSPYNS